MKKKAYEELVRTFMNLPGQDIKLEQIYRIVSREPSDSLTPTQMHSRCSRAIGEARTALTREGYVLALGELKNSYRAVKRVR